MKRENEFKEIIFEKELTDLSIRIQKLPSEKIDDLWCLCGFIISGGSEKFKAVRQIDICRIRKSIASAKKVVLNLIAETPAAEFRKNLSKVEE